MSEQAPPSPPDSPGSPGPATATKQKEKGGQHRRPFGQVLRESILEGNSVTAWMIMLPVSGRRPSGWSGVGVPVSWVVVAT